MSETTIEPGYCQCGCGEKPNLATQNNIAYGWITGQPYPYARGHRNRKPDSIYVPIQEPIRIEPGYCHCGCGEQTNPVRQTDPARGLIKGHPRRFVKGHQRRYYALHPDVPRGYRRCTQCKRLKPSDHFPPRNNRAGQPHSVCARCTGQYGTNWKLENPEKAKMTSHKSNISLKFNMTTEEYRSIHDKQGGLCAICNNSETYKRKNGLLKMLVVDHDHGTGRIRGLLCNRCNRALGWFQDDYELLKSAMAYLKRNQ